MVAALLSGNALMMLSADTSAAPRGSSVLEAETEHIHRDLGDGVTLLLAPGTRVVRQGWLRVTLANGQTKRAHYLALLNGRLDVEVRKQGDGPVPVVVAAPRKVVGLVRSGQAIITADKSAIALAALQGDAMAASDNNWRQLAPGFVRAFTAQDPAGHPRPLVATPEPNVQTRLLVALPGRTVAARATWAAVEDAVSYDVAIKRLDGEERKVFRQLSTSQPEVSLDNLPPGNFTLSVRAVDGVGISSKASAPLSLRVLGVELPERARVAGDAIMLRRHQRVQFTHAEGLELTYDRATLFVPVPDSAGLNRGREVVVRLRERGRTDEARLTLVPMVLTTDVELGPPLAEWPGDTVTLRIRVRNESGGAEDQEVSIRPEVTVNGKGVSPRWSQRGDLWLGTVPPPSTPGPWVVRVKVFDGFGELTGRASLEVARRSKK
ncbi:MAG: hypothetical protein JW940_36155 [Polyangiaceae bacterium]|nr:hypothetical protein [Polyangiaceae bacterium]